MMNISNDVKVFGGLIAATVILIVGAVFFLGGKESPNSQAQTANPTTFSKKNLVDDESWKVGSDSAKVTVVEFGDYQCPTCKVYAPVVESMKSKYKNKILFVYRHFPIVQAHPFAMSAASAAEAAGSQGKFWEYHDKLYKISPSLERENLIKIAEDLKLDMTKFKTDMDSDASRQNVLDDLAAGNKVGVNGTPTFFINGKQYSLSELQNLKGFEAIINPLLK